MPTHRPFTRRQALENRRFLRALRATGNPRLAADLLGVHRSTYLKRRKKNAAFAQNWAAAIAAAHADFHEKGGAMAPLPSGDCGRFRVRPGDGPAAAMLGRGAGHLRQPQPLRTTGGELHVGRTRNGRLQLRRAPKGWMTKAGEQAFLAALGATANVRLSAAAAGFTHSAFYQKKAKRPAFARELRLARAQGYDRVEIAAVFAALPESYEDDAWRHNDPPPIPPMTPDQAIQLLHLHQKSVCYGWDTPHRRRRRGEPWEAYKTRLSAMWVHEQTRAAEDERLRRLAEAETPAEWHLPEDELPGLPDLSQVGNWSAADPAKAKHNPDLALFGGWRLKDWKRSRT